mmetsp:Transcript_12407/g.32912  ORF Transcript_12407/g.32912 Transcript_12407/m.32912 type:complete len:215 (-) Transcript_12407:669-1313(-)
MLTRRTTGICTTQYRTQPSSPPHLQNLDPHPQRAAWRVDLLPPVHAEIVRAVHSLLREVVREGSRPRGAHTQEEGHHRGSLQAVGLELERPLQRAPLERGRRLCRALALPAPGALRGLPRGHRHHEAQVREAERREGRRDHGPASVALQLAAESVDAPFDEGTPKHGWLNRNALRCGVRSAQRGERALRLRRGLPRLQGRRRSGRGGAGEPAEP